MLFFAKPAIPCKRPGANERDLSADWEAALFTKCCYSSHPSLQVSSKATDLRIFKAKEFRKGSLFISGKQGRITMVDHQSKVKQWEVNSNCKTTNDYSIICQ